MKRPWGVSFTAIRTLTLITVAVVALLVAAALLSRVFAEDSPSGGTGAMLHPREGSMYHQPYTSTR
jgi:hypothetical protein